MIQTLRPVDSGEVNSPLQDRPVRRRNGLHTAGALFFSGSMSKVLDSRRRVVVEFRLGRGGRDVVGKPA